METNVIWILKFRDFTIKDLKLGVRSKDTAKSALRFFEEGIYHPCTPGMGMAVLMWVG